MKFQCSHKDLSHALDVVTHVIDANVTLPVLNNILVRAEDGKISFSSTNLEMAVNYWVEAEVEKEGAVTIPAKLFAGYVNLLKDDRVNIELQEGLTVAIHSASSKTKIKCISADEYPTLSQLDDVVTLKLDADGLPNALSQVSFAASSTNTRPVLAGVYFHVNDSGLTLVATDSFRLSEKKMSLLEPVTQESSCIVPTRAVSEFARLCGKEDGVEEVEVHLAKNQIFFRVGRIELYSRLIEGNFPNYQQILPKGLKTSTTLDTSDQSLAVKRVNLFARENNNKVIFDFQQDHLSISTPATQVGEEKGTLPIALDGDPGQIALNSEFVLDVLNHLGSDQVDIGMNDSMSPAVFRPVGEGSEDFLHIIMPLKLQ